MKFGLTLGLLLSACLWASALESGAIPRRSVIQRLSWGNLSYESGKQGTCQLDTTTDGYKFVSSQGEVAIKGSEVEGFRLTCGREVFTITPMNGDLEIHSPSRIWTLRNENGKLTLKTTAPNETLVFDRNGETFTITGSKGVVKVTNEYGNLRIQSPLGLTKVNNDLGRRTFSGPAIDGIPYLGRGFTIRFHGIVVYVDITRRFPMPEVNEWLSGRNIID